MGYDLLIKNGTVVDGSEAPPRVADVAVAAGKIGDGAKRVTDAADCVVAPGITVGQVLRS
jgi:N-acyl-D-amino-acid deacylase